MSALQGGLLKSEFQDSPDAYPQKKAFDLGLEVRKWELVLMAGDGGWKMVLVSARAGSSPLSSEDRLTAMPNFSRSLFTALLKGRCS